MVACELGMHKAKFIPSTKRQNRTKNNNNIKGQNTLNCLPHFLSCCVVRSVISWCSTKAPTGNWLHACRPYSLQNWSYGSLLLFGSFLLFFYVNTKWTENIIARSGHISNQKALGEGSWPRDWAVFSAHNWPLEAEHPSPKIHKPNPQGL